MSRRVINEGDVYYQGKLESLKSIFGVDNITLEADSLTVGEKSFPILNDVIILTEPERYTSFVKSELRFRAELKSCESEEFAEDIQFTFGREWEEYGDVLPEHEQEFAQYFDLVDLDSLRHSRACDLGCGSGRWSYFLKDLCQEVVLVDFSDAIFIARMNLSTSSNCLFFMGDLTSLPFKKNFCEFVACLGVLHHLPMPCLDAVRQLQQCAPRLLIFLYNSFENRPSYFRFLLRMVTLMRRWMWQVRDPGFRKLFSRVAALCLYKPFIYLGWMLRPLKLSCYVPLYESYHNKSLQRIEQDVYDRFFTRIEQRVSRREILELRDSFTQVIVADDIPYWHFLCVR